MKLHTFSQLVAFLLFVALSAIPAKSAPKFVTTQVTTERSNYKLGEVVEVKWSIRNNTTKTIELGGDAKSWSYFQIAFDNDTDYRVYSPGGGNGLTVDGVNFGSVIEAKKSLTRNQEFLWNYKPQVSHLSADAAAHESEGRILTDLAFPAVGRYFIRLFTHINLDGVAADYVSAPIEINIGSPTELDEPVWQRIAENPDIAYFMQYADMPHGKYNQQTERDTFQQTIQDLVSASPMDCTPRS
ncbi:MAG: hypothetical protein QM785_15865 [Pyrinomonadaceae bacterium]